MRAELKVTPDRHWALAFLASPATHVVAALLAGAAMMAYVGYRWQTDHLNAYSKYRSEVDARTSETAEAARFQIAVLYQGLRAIARLPGVRNMDRWAANLAPDSKKSIQELYGNLASSIDVSELYVTSVDFDPKRKDPRTGNLEVPAIKFDELAAGQHAVKANPLRGSLRDDASGPAAFSDAQEYEEIVRQIATLKAAYPTSGAIKDLDYPAVSSPELITGDTRFFSHRPPDNASRSGIVYSVPFYGSDGRMRGIVSGVVLTRAVHALLGGGGHVLKNTGTGFVSGPIVAGERLFTSRSKAKIIDARGGWVVEAPGLKAAYLAREDVRAADRMAVQGFGLAAVLTLALLLAARMHRRFADRAFNREASLDAMIRARTAELNAKLRELEAHRAELEAARQDAIQSSEAKSQFLANMSHELRTPLNAILGFSDLMRQEIRGPLGHASYKGYAGDIHRSGAHLLSLINDILDLSKIEAGRFEIDQGLFNPHQAFQTAIEILALRAQDAGVTVYNQVSPHFDLHGDERAVRQIALNLLTNAIKFTPAGGSVHAQSFMDARWLTIRVIDTGKGIAPDDVERVFENFGQGRHDHAVKDRGTGLGLPIVRGLIAAHGGDVRIESALGRGTSVILRLPAALVRPAASAA